MWLFRLCRNCFGFWKVKVGSRLRAAFLLFEVSFEFSFLWTGDDFVGRRRENEFHAAFVVGLQGFGYVEICEIDLFAPVAVGVVVAAGVKNTVGDGVVADFFAVAVAEDQNRRRQRCGGDHLRRG